MSGEGIYFETNRTALQDIGSATKVGMEAGANVINAIVSKFPPLSTSHNRLGKLATSPANAVGIELQSGVAHGILPPAPFSAHRQPDADQNFASRLHVHPTACALSTRTARSSIFSADRQVSVPDGRITDERPSGPWGWLRGGLWGNSKGLSSLSSRIDEQTRNGGSERLQLAHADNGENCQALTYHRASHSI